MNDWFEWNGVRCTTLGIHVSEQPPITFAEERVKFVDVPGRSGSLTTIEADDTYEDVVLSASCVMKNVDNIGAIAAFLKGAGTVKFANRPDGFYYARIVNQIPFEQVMRGRPNKNFTVNFRCKPFLYISDVADITLSSAGTITNPYPVHSLPLVVVNGTGDVTIQIDERILELTDLSGTITMDSEMQEAWSGNNSANGNMDGEFIRLKPGANAYIVTGNVSSVVISPRWRTL